MADELIALITYYDDDAAKVELRQLVKHTVDKWCAIDWHHTLGA